jgi:hypothetical protein
MDDSEDEASSSNLPSTEPQPGGSFGLPQVTSRPPSRVATRPGTPTGFRMLSGPAGIGLTGHPLSGQATPTTQAFEAHLRAQGEELSSLRNGQVAANHNISLLLQFTSDLAQSRMDMMMHMSQQTELFRVQLDARMPSFAQGVEAPVNQAIHTSSTAADIATELAGRYVGLEANVERSFNDAAATRHASEEVAAATLRQTQDAFQKARIDLEAATISMTQVRHENATSQAQTEALTAQLVQTRLPERDLPRPFADARILERMQQRVNLEAEQCINLEAEQ